MHLVNPYMTEAPVTYREYYSRWIRAFRLDLLRLGKKEMIGAVLAVLILAFQWYYGFIPQDHGWQAVKSLGWPYLLLLIGLLVVSAIRAPVCVDRDRAKTISQLTETSSWLQETTTRLQADNASLKQEMARPAGIPPQILMIAQEGWEKLDGNEQKAIKLLLDFGDMTERNVIRRLNIQNLSHIFHNIEAKTNFVLRTVQAFQLNENAVGYQGTWTINPHFKEALRQIAQSIQQT